MDEIPALELHAAPLPPQLVQVISKGCQTIWQCRVQGVLDGNIVGDRPRCTPDLDRSQPDRVSTGGELAARRQKSFTRQQIVEPDQQAVFARQRAR